MIPYPYEREKPNFELLDIFEKLAAEHGHKRGFGHGVVAPARLLCENPRELHTHHGFALYF